jgi:hypothetical protein
VREERVSENYQKKKKKSTRKVLTFSRGHLLMIKRKTRFRKVDQKRLAKA